MVGGGGGGVYSEKFTDMYTWPVSVETSVLCYLF